VRLGARAMRRHPGLAALFLVMTVAEGGLQGLMIWALRAVLLRLGGSQSVGDASLLLAAGAILAVSLAQSASVYFGELVSVRLSTRVEVESMWEVLGKLLTLPVRFFDRNSQADVVMASYYDVKGIRSVTTELGRFVLYLSRIAGLAVVAWILSPKLAVVGLVAVPVGALPAHWFGQRITRAADRERTAVTTLHDSFYQLIGGIRMIKVGRGETRVLQAARQIGAELRKQVLRQARDRGLSRFLLEAVSSIGLIVVILVGGREVAAGRLGWQSLLGVLIAVVAVYAPVVGILQMYGTLRSVIPSLSGVERILREPPALKDQAHARRLTDAPRTIALEDVSFQYQAETVLRSITASFQRGETIGIVGPSGAGKSTLLSLLLRFYEPAGGRILLDGVDLREIRHADLMELSALVLQEPFVFRDTVANNIRWSRPDAPLDEVIRAARAADIHDEIEQMENGYETVLGAGRDGRGVSVGQKQRISIASALFKNAPLLFLDEATSNLDSVSERRVQAAIDRLMDGRTTFVIAHRLSTLRKASRLLVLDEGRLAGLGTHDELLQSCPTYRSLWGTQVAFGREEPVLAMAAERRRAAHGPQEGNA
jgi:ABC-type multidrug transport system fused ATPase/permease subunit